MEDSSELQPAEPQPAAKPQPKWRPIVSIDRRVLGVLVEKAKTTPDQYPMTLNGLCNGCNQKSNRFPMMDLKPEDVEQSLDRLKGIGAVAEVQGSGRVSKYRHFMYEWLGVEKGEMSIMTELLLRGAQTEGELRTRASRMEREPIADLTALRRLLDSLQAKKLVVSLTPAGRGHVITHALYEPREMDKLRAEHHASAQLAADDDTPPSAPARPAPQSAQPSAMHGSHASSGHAVSSHAASSHAASSSASSGGGEAVQALQRQVDALRSEVKQLRADVAELSSQFERSQDEVRTLKDSLGGF